MHRTGPNHRQNPGPARAAAGINLIVVVGFSSGAHVTVVATVSNAGGIGKAFMK